MSNNHFLLKLLSIMYDYQKDYNIKNKCCDNSLFFYDMIETNYKKGICIPVIGVMHYFDETLHQPVFVAHCWCKLNGKIIDPSYQYSSACVPYKKTYGTVHEIFNLSVKRYGHILSPSNKKIIIENITLFQFAMNKFLKNTKMTTDYYNKIRDYVNEKYKECGYIV